MAQKKAHEVDGWLAKPDPRAVIVLVYGPDRGLVAERAARFASGLGLALDDPFSVIRLDASELDATPGRLLDEANTFSMFGGRRLIWIRNAGAQKALADQLRSLADRPPPDTVILVEGGDLKKAAPLRTVAEAGAAAMALPCYQDESRALDGLIEEVLATARLGIGDEARDELRRHLGGDRMASRRELEKLALYCAGQNTVTHADVIACVGDASTVSAEDVIDAMLAGDLDRADDRLSRLSFSGGSPQQVLGGAMRIFAQLQLMRDAVEASRVAPAAAVAGARPPIHFSRRRSIETVLARLEAKSLSSITRRLQSGIFDSRKRADLALPITRQAVMAVSADIHRAIRKSR